MAKWLIMAGLIVVFGGLVLFFKPKSFYVRAVSDVGELELTDGSKIKLANISVSPPGENKHDAAIFMIQEMTKNTEVWYKPSGDGYRVWLGCRRVLWMTDCRKGILLNDALVQAGVAYK